jgi:hypothetical protein
VGCKIEEPSYNGKVKMGDEELEDVVKIPVGHCRMSFVVLGQFKRASGEKREIRGRECVGRTLAVSYFKFSFRCEESWKRFVICKRWVSE